MKESPLVRQPELLAWFLLTDVSRIIRQMVDAEMKALDLTRAQWYLLTHTYYYEGMTQQQLADLMDLGKSSTAKLIHKLEKKNWIERESDPNDARLSRVSLTPRVHATVRNLTTLCALAIQHSFEDISQSELDQLLSVLRKIEKTLLKGPPTSSPDLKLLRKKIADEFHQNAEPRNGTAKSPRGRRGMKVSDA